VPVALGVVLHCLLHASPASADIVAQWTFESSQPANAGPFSPELGSGSASGFHAGSSTYSSPVGNGSAHSYSSNNWQVGDYYQFTVSASGYQNIHVSWDQKSSIQGPGYFDLRYSTDGINFTTFSSYISEQYVWNSNTSIPQATLNADLSSVDGLNGASVIYFRFIDTSLGAIGGGQVLPGGTSSVDNVTISAGVASVPEPSSLLLTGLLASGLGLFRILRRGSREG